MSEMIYLTINQVIAMNAMQIHLYSPEELLGVRDSNLLS